MTSETKDTGIVRSESFSITIPIAPQAWQRVNRDRHGTIYVPSKTRNFKAAVSKIMKAAIGNAEPIKKAMSIGVTFYLMPPKRLKQKQPITRPDLDNYLKAILDAGNGIIWADDSVIIGISAWKHYSYEPRIELHFSEY